MRNVPRAIDTEVLRYTETNTSPSAKVSTTHGFPGPFSRRAAMAGLAGAAAAGVAVMGASPAAAATAVNGVVQLDAYPGATDDDKLTAALADVRAQTKIPAIQFPARTVTLSQTRTYFNGMKLIGPGVNGPKNLELSGGSLVTHKVMLNVGNGASSWMVGSGSVYDVFVGGLALQAGNSSAQLWHQPTGSLYACQFDNLNIYGFKHAFGMPSAKCLVTQVVFSGHWTVLGGTDTQFTLGGSDCSLWMGGYVNLGSRSSGGAGRYLMILDSLGKTDVGKVYITSVGGWRGLWCRNNSCKLNFYGGEFEGSNASVPCDGNVIRVDAGNVAFFGPWIAYGMNAPLATEHALIEVNGGNVLIDRPCYGRGNAAETVPMVYIAGGKAEIRSAAPDGPWTGLPRVRKVGGVLVSDSSVTLI